MAFGTSWPGETKDGRGIERNRHAVWYDWVLGDHAIGFEAAYHARDRIRHAVAQVNTCIAKAHACHGGGQHHGSTGFVVFWISYSTYKILGDIFNGFERPDITNGV